jgi:hypothetical protein
MILQEFAPGLWEVNSWLKVAGVNIGHRMTVARLSRNALWIHSPVQYSGALELAFRDMGRLEHIVAPNCMHDTHLDGWFGAFPRLRFHAAPGLSRVRSDLDFTDTLSDAPDPAWADFFDQHLLRGMPRLNEVVFFHRSSRTLILTDLVFNLGEEESFLSRTLMKLNDCYCKFGPSRLLRTTIKDRRALRDSLDHILGWDFDGIILSHGANIPSGGKAMLREAFAFL